ncbi:fungal-specific transcription factor domain-containing protein [Coniochaeta sp. 2T2.1]|nr:fungal-specific transcription factor domain-containing protein [Coniochaeta sp. 2T2.1]
MEKETASLAPRLSKTCDQCKGRKVRCIVQPGQSACKGCVKRRVNCRFSHTKRLLRNPSGEPAEQEATQIVTQGQGNDCRRWSSVNDSMPQAGPASPPSDYKPHDELYIDRLLENPGTGGLNVREDCIFKRHEDFISSSNLAIFSESRIRLLSQRLGHNKVRDLVERVAAALDVKHHSRNDLLDNPPPNIIREAFKLAGQPNQNESQLAGECIKAYFENVHPQFPFLDRVKFEQRANDPGLSEYLNSNRPFSALYHAVLALGCQYIYDKTLDPINGDSWKFASVSLGLLPLVLLPRETLVNLQAITAMAIYALNVACLNIAETLVLEAARMVQAMGYHRVMSRSDPVVLCGLEDECDRTFWVVYMIERTTCFLNGRSPSLADYDIACPIPPAPESLIEGMDWFVTMLRLCRLCSKAYELLFSTSSTMKCPRQYMTAIARIRADIRRWESLIPAPYRPGRKSCYPMPSSAWVHMLLKLDYLYYWLAMALCRLELHVGPAAGTDEASLAESTKELMAAGRNVIQLTKDIDMRPYIGMWVRGTVPLAAMFILFDLVVHNPAHPETELNLSLLDMAAGYFGRFDYATNGAVPAALLSGFAHIANQFVKEAREQSASPRPHSAINAGSAPISPDSLDENKTQQTGALELGVAEPGLSGAMAPNQQLNTSFDAPLSYPTMSMEGVDPMLDDELLAGFDFTNMFGYVMPEALTNVTLRDYLLN